MSEMRHMAPTGVVRYFLDGDQAIIVSGKLSSIKHFLDKRPIIARVHAENPLSKQLKGWSHNGDWVYSSTE
jgi:hypothetical protein